MIKRMLVTPIYKKENTSNPENYRAISLLSISGKVFNRIILNKIREMTNDTQFGFHPRKRDNYRGRFGYMSLSLCFKHPAAFQLLGRMFQTPSRTF